MLNKEMLPVFWGLLLVATIAVLFLQGRLYSMLQHRYPRHYAELGRPRLLGNNGLRVQAALLKYLFGRRYLQLDDSALEQLCRGIQALSCLDAFLLFCSLALIF